LKGYDDSWLKKSSCTVLSTGESIVSREPDEIRAASPRNL
jgi:hypothetical protein